MEKKRKEAINRRLALGAFANSVKATGKFEWVMTTIIFMIFGGVIVFFTSKLYNFPAWAFYISIAFVVLVGIYVGYEIYLSRVIRGNELKSLLELSSLVGHVIEKLDKIEQAVIKEMDIVIGIKRDVVRDEQEKVEISKLSAEKIKKDIAINTEENMVFKWCSYDKEDVYVSKQMELCPFCWNKLENKNNDLNKTGENSNQTNEKINDAEEIIFD